MRANQLSIFNLVSLSGDTDLYVWKPRAGFKPNYYSNGIPAAPGLSLDAVGFSIPEEGVYVVEVQAVTDAYYRLVTAGDLPSSGLLAETKVNSALARLTNNDLAALQAQDAALLNVRQTLPHSTHLTLAEKDRPAHPFTLSTPYQLSDVDALPGVEVESMIYLYLPLIVK